MSALLAGRPMMASGKPGSAAPGLPWTSIEVSKALEAILDGAGIVGGVGRVLKGLWRGRLLLLFPPHRVCPQVVVRESLQQGFSIEIRGGRNVQEGENGGEQVNDLRTLDAPVGDYVWPGHHEDAVHAVRACEVRSEGAE